MNLERSSLSHERALKRAMMIALIFMGIEVLFGWIAHSLALISDALHLFTDVGALLLSLLVIRIAKKPSTPWMSFGYHRAETLGALASALSIWILSAVLVYQAIERLLFPSPVEGMLVFVVASIGLLANLLMMRLLHPEQMHSLNLKAAYLHVLGDLLGSIGVILSGLIIWWTHWNLADPLITLIFACVLLYSSGKIIKQTIKILMHSTPEEIDPIRVHEDLLQLEGVKEVHDLHIWSVATNRVALSVHLIADSPKVLQEAHRLIEEKYKILHMTIQIEDPLCFEPKYCYDCKNCR